MGKTHAGRCAKIPRAGCAAQVQSFASLCTVQRGSVGVPESWKALGFCFLRICAGAVIDRVMRRCVQPPGAAEHGIVAARELAPACMPEFAGGGGSVGAVRSWKRCGVPCCILV